MDRSLHLQALVVHTRNYDEADRFVTFLTPYHGRVSALARSVRKLSSHKAGHLQPSTYVDVQLNRGTGETWKIGQVTTIEAFPGILNNLEKTVRASCVLELAERFSLDDLENPQLFHLTLETLRRMNRSNDTFPLQRYFDLHLLDTAGYRPQLQKCVTCSKPIQAVDQYFNFDLGGVQCPDCGYLARGARPVGMRVLKYLRYYQAHTFDEISAAGWPSDLRFESESLLTSYQTYLLNRKTNSQNFLERL